MLVASSKGGLRCWTHKPCTMMHNIVQLDEEKHFTHRKCEMLYQDSGKITLQWKMVPD